MHRTKQTLSRVLLQDAITSERGCLGGPYTQGCQGFFILWLRLSTTNFASEQTLINHHSISLTNHPHPLSSVCQFPKRRIITLQLVHHHHGSHQIPNINLPHQFILDPQPNIITSSQPKIPLSSQHNNLWRSSMCTCRIYLVGGNFFSAKEKWCGTRRIKWESFSLEAFIICELSCLRLV